MRLRWLALARAGPTGKPVPIGRGEGFTDRDGALPVRFRARAATFGLDPRVWATEIGVQVEGQDDFGRPIRLARAIRIALAPGSRLDAGTTRPAHLSLLRGPAGRYPSADKAAANFRATLSRPRFMRVGDRAMLLGRVSNSTPFAHEVTGLLDLHGVETAGALRRRSRLAPGGSGRYDWDVVARRAGAANAALTAQGAAIGAAATASWEVLPAGRQVGQAWVGDLAAPASLAFSVPPGAAADSVNLAIVVAGSPRLAAIEAAQALLREPVVSGGADLAAAKLLAASAALRATTAGGSAIPANGTPDRIAAATFRAAGAEALRQVEATQNSDGGWSWLPGHPSVPEITAFVLRALDSAEAVGLGHSRAQRLAADHIRRLEPQDPEDAAMALWALGPEASPALRDRVWNKLKRLSPTGLARAVAGLAHAGDARSLAALAQLDLRVRDEAGLPHWRSGMSRRSEPAASTVGGPGDSPTWDSGDIEATALAAAAHVALDPLDNLVPGSLRWLLRTRQGERWGSPRVTALAVLALSEAATARPWPVPPGTRLSAHLDGHSLGTFPLRADGPLRLTLTSTELPPGMHQVVLRSTSPHPTFTAALRYREAERAADSTPRSQPSTPGGPLVLKREYFQVPVSRLARAGGLPLQDLIAAEQLPGPRSGQAGPRIPLDHAIVVRLELNSDRDLAFLRITDPIPAGAAVVALPAVPGYLRTAGPHEVFIHATALGPGRHRFYHALLPYLPGMFAVPAPVAEAVDAPDMRARGVAMRVELVP